MSTHHPRRGAGTRPPRRHKSRLRADMPLLGGVRPPLAALLCALLAVVALTALVLGRTTTQDVAPAVLSSQQHIAEDSAADVRASIDEDVSTLRHAAGILAAEPAQDGASALRRLGSLGHSWRGAALVDPSGDKLLAVTGEALPLSAVSGVKADDEIPPRLVTLPSGQVRLLAFATVELPKEGKQLLVASDTLAPTVPGGDPLRTLVLVDRKGKTLVTAAAPAVPVAAAGAKPTTAPAATVDAADSRLPAQIARTAGASRADQAERKSSGSALGSVHGGERTVAGWAVLATAEASESAHALGLTVVTTVSTPQSSNVTGNSLFALFAAGSLLLAALLVTLMLTLGLQRPLLRLHAGGVRLVRGNLSRPVRVPMVGETARIGAALEALRRQLNGDPDNFRPLRRRFGSRALVVCAALVLTSWSVPLLLLLNRPVAAVAVPKQLVNDQQVRTSAIAEQVRQTLDSGYLDLAGVGSALTPTTTPEQAHALLATAAEQHSRYRSLYVLSKDGSVLAQVGGKPERPAGAIPAGSGLLQVNTSGRVPVVAAYSAVPAATAATTTTPPGTPATPGKTAPVATVPAQTPASPVTVVAEFDIKFLDAGLDHAGVGEVWLVDERDRVIASNEGFRAFQALPAGSLTNLADTAAKSAAQRGAGVLQASGDSAIAAVAPLGTAAAPIAPRVGGTVATQPTPTPTPTNAGTTGRTLGWQVVTSQPTSWLNLGEYRTQRLTMLAGLLGLAAATGCLGWLFVVVVRPLRELAGAAERLAAGDRRTVLYPVHHDEIGSVTRSLELVRQQLAPSSRSGNKPPTRV